jgi:pimeloyl-ACP methyl ester carboxylesterase
MRHGIKRMFLSVLISVGIILLVLFLYERWSRSYIAIKYPPPGQLVDVGGRKLHLHCVGNGNVTVLLEDGLGPVGSLGWIKVQSSVGQFARVCAYDRAGIMWSEPSSQAPTADQVAQDLHAALGQAGIKPPYVLVGLSMGGIYCRIFTEIYPDEVIGMVLVDSAHPEQEERFPTAPVKITPSPINLWLLRQSAAIGTLRLENYLLKPKASGRIPSEILPKLRAFYPSSVSAVQAESQLFHANLHRGQKNLSLGNRPLVVLTATKPKPLNMYPRGYTQEYLQQERAVWQELQAELATLSSESQHIISEESGHLMYFDQPELIVNAIRDLVEVVQRDRPPQSL